MTHGSLFSGIGGFDLAAEWMGWENVFHCEINPFGRKILNYYWPDAISYEDIKTTDFSQHAGRIDIISGGFPCQPYSLAGKRKGKEDDRHLWPEMLRAIGEIRPRWIVGENVHGIVNWSKGMVFNEIQTDLEIAGYETFAYVLPACSLDAPHRRDRMWLIAHSNSTGHRRLQSESRTECEDTIRVRGTCQKETTSNPDSNGQFGCNSENEIISDKGGQYALHDTFKSNIGNVANAQCQRLQRNDRVSESIGPESRVTKNIPGFENFPTVSPFCDGNDGLSNKLDGITFSEWRRQSVKSGGNSIVPQMAHMIFKTIELFESNTPPTPKNIKRTVD